MPADPPPDFVLPPPIEVVVEVPLIHFFDTTTMEYLRSVRLEEGQPVPEDATRTEPPPSRVNCSIIWDGEFWNLIEDHRGEVWYDADGNPVTITELGDPADHGLSPTPPPTS